MIKSTVWLIFLIIIFLSCNKSSAKESVNIYIGGFRQEIKDNHLVSYAKYWKNGVSTNVTDGSTWVFVNDMAVDNDNIYFAGHERPFAGSTYHAKYWKNGIGYSLDSVQSDAISIAAANNNVYISGYESAGNLQNFFWKNGTVTTFNYTITDLYASGNDIYKAAPPYYYWKNDVIYTTQDQNARFNSITASGENIYCAGSVYNSTGNITIATYWINGIPQNIGFGQVNSIVAVGNDLYMAGFTYYSFEKIATYWKNGVAVKLMENASANCIAVDKNQDVHVIGTDINGYSKYWKNGQEIHMPAADSLDFFVSIRVN